MPNRPVTSDRLQELRDEREAADRAYNDALTAVDRALVRPVELSRHRGSTRARSAR